ncbi:integrase domain-containing protein [Vibrio alfacsensis]|uniref:integrase domain-containing protein n=1 Tax=Vibrio alfacsensis TaxID=1074311 RepID=UPI004067A169
MMRNLKLRNLGLGNRCMRRALLNAYGETVHSYASQAHAKSAINRFHQYLSSVHSIKDLRFVSREHVMGFADTLREECEENNLSVRSAKNYLSTINVALANARLDDRLSVHPVKDAGFPNTSGIAVINLAATLEMHNRARAQVTPRLSSQLSLLRTLGLRFKESCLLDCHQALKQAKEHGHVFLEFGTKGGRPRSIPIKSQAQLDALTIAAQHQQHDTSMIPSNLTWAQYQNRCYREVAGIKGYHFHSERHHYAQARYVEELGIQCPIKLGMSRKEFFKFFAQTRNISIQAAKQLDRQARLIIAKQLGHSRVSITGAYLG